MNAAFVEAQLSLFRKSVLKQSKWRAIRTLLGPTPVRRGLDLGADNGVISHLLRASGASWSSADMDPVAVETIRQMVETDVHLTDGRHLSFADATFDAVVVIDMLEHVADDAGLIEEIARVLKLGGRLLVNVPHVKRFPLLRPLRLALGLTDQWHGHLRPGYNRKTLSTLLEDRFVIETWRTYNRFFSELLDILLNYAYRRKTQSGSGTTKGTIVTAADLQPGASTLRLYSILYPAFVAFAALDGLVPFAGYSLIVSARKRA